MQRRSQARTRAAARQSKPRQPTGLALIDALESRNDVGLDDYLLAVSEYVRMQRSLASGGKSAQIRLSGILAKALLHDLRRELPGLTEHAKSGEIKVSGGLRGAQIDIVEFHPLDGIRLAIEIKPVNVAVGRALWNRFGDVRVTAVNVHLKFPFAVVGGVMPVAHVRRNSGEEDRSDQA